MQPALDGTRVPGTGTLWGGIPWLGFGLRLAGALVWIFAGASKLPDLAGFADQVQRYQVLPGFLVPPAAFILPFFEIFLGVYLAAGLFVRASALAGTVLFAIFLAAQIQALIRGLKLDCGCFGALSKSAVGPWTLLRDMALGVPTFVMLALPARKLSLDSRLFGARDRFAPNS
ncbi:MAG TPA: MauE/DoxX family redox-associated membrane protein [Spirochaetia bacterium]|nr:MauE/DoxX family redox-associated membrane protein [Spirochaetia bacterium]